MADLLAAPLPAKIALITLFLALAISVVTDLRRHLILNAVTVPALVMVLSCMCWLGGLPLLTYSAGGVLASAGIPALAALVNSRLMGWGDVKLLAVCGAVAGGAAGWGFALMLFVYVSIAGGLEAALWLLAARLRGRERPKYVPYGLAIAAGAGYAFLWGGVLF
ncbi:MAG: prepilin peptidase [Myxococcales bacterium]|nr:prepilin peptidase [Myxococcales bacterium]